MPSYNESDVFAGRYRLVKLIGRGGFSEVWKAEDEMTENVVVAIKIYAPEGGLDEFGVSQFRKEYVLTHSLKHSNLLNMYYFDIYNGSPYLVMPFYQKGSVRNLFNSKDGQPEEVIARILKDIGDALAYLHSREPVILHQDIKPDNILMADDGHFILTDFGISTRTRNTIRKQTSTANNSLSPSYAPPEKFAAKPFSNAASDVFSFGVMLYELCIGDLPWGGYGGIAVLQGAEIPGLPAHYSTALNELVISCMHPDASLRPTAKQLEQAGDHFLRHGFWGNEKKATVPPVAEAPKSAPSKNKFASTAALLTVLCLVLVGGVFLYASLSKTQKPDPSEVVAEAPLVEPVAETTEIPAPAAPLQEPAKVAVVTAKDDMEAIKAVKPALAVETASNDKEEIAQPKTLGEYLNALSDDKISKRVKEKWRPEIKALFKDPNQLIIDGKDDIVYHIYTIDELISLLINARKAKVVINQQKLNQANKVYDLKVDVIVESPF